MTQPIGKKRTPIPVIVAIVVVAAIIIIAAIALVAITLENRAILIVWLNSHHANSTIDYRLFVDGQLKRTGLLNPYGSVQIILSIPLNDGSKTVNVYADSTGGEFGTTSDSQNVFLEKHMATSVSLSI